MAGTDWFDTIVNGVSNVMVAQAQAKTIRAVEVPQNTGATPNNVSTVGNGTAQTPGDFNVAGFPIKTGAVLTAVAAAAAIYFIVKA